VCLIVAFSLPPAPPAPPVPVLIKILLAVGNACLIYLTAQGGTSTANAVTGGGSGTEAGTTPRPMGTGFRNLWQAFVRPW
jgi:hypothetical protein